MADRFGTPEMTDRQRHEMAVYDDRAAATYAALDDGQLLVDPAVPPFPNREHVDFLTHALDQLGELRGRRVLEVGSSSGTLGTYLALQGATVVGIDVSRRMLEVAARRAEVNGVSDRFIPIAQPVETLADPSGSFDAVIGNQVLHHLDLGAAMANIRRMLAPTGRAVFCEPVLLAPEFLRSLRNSRAVSKLFPLRTDTPDERSLGRDEIELICGAFERSEVVPFQVMCRLQNFLDLSDRWFERLHRIDEAVLRRVPAARRACRYVVLTLGATAPSEEIERPARAARSVNSMGEQRR